MKATPNDNANLYYRNNMMLMVTVPVDMSKCYSVDADGAQIQSLGSTTATVFSALPGKKEIIPSVLVQTALKLPV